MIFVLKDIVYYFLRRGNDTHIETEKEFKVGVFEGDGEECLDSSRSPIILTDVKGESVDAAALSGLNVLGKCFGRVRVCIPHHEVAEHMLISGILHFDRIGNCCRGERRFLAMVPEEHGGPFFILICEGVAIHTCRSQYVGGPGTATVLRACRAMALTSRRCVCNYRPEVSKWQGFRDNAEVDYIRE